MEIFNDVKNTLFSEPVEEALEDGNDKIVNLSDQSKAGIDLLVNIVCSAVEEVRSGKKSLTNLCASPFAELALLQFKARKFNNWDSDDNKRIDGIIHFLKEDMRAAANNNNNNVPAVTFSGSGPSNSNSVSPVVLNDDNSVLENSSQAKPF